MTLLELLIEALGVALFGRRQSSAYSVEKLETVRAIDSIRRDLFHVTCVDSALVEPMLWRRPERVQRKDYDALIKGALQRFGT